MIIKSYAKLNLYLEVLNKRKDAYHNIRTIFEKIDLADKISLKLRPKDKKIKLSTNSPELATDNRNLVYRAAELLQETLGAKSGVEIKLTKHIPIGAGLGGGSSDAASVLMGLNKLWKLGLSQKKLLCYARKLGSDVAFFLYNYSFAKASGRGEMIKPLKVHKRLMLWHILVVPKIKVSTPVIYKSWDTHSELTEVVSNGNIIPLALKRKDYSLLEKGLFNSLEKVSVRLYPQIKRVRNKLADLGVKSILMTGSGAAVFGIVSSRKEAASLARKLRKEMRSAQVFVTKTA